MSQSTSAHEENPYVSPKAAARILGVHPVTVYAWIKQGRLPAIRRAGTRLLLRRSDVKALLQPVVPSVPVPTRQQYEQEQAAALAVLRNGGVKV